MPDGQGPRAPRLTRSLSASSLQAHKLQRARNLLKSTGEPVHALDVFSTSASVDPYYEKLLSNSDLRTRRRGQSGLGGSIKRKLKEVKVSTGTGIKSLNPLARSKSTRSTPHTVSTPGRHGRSFSASLAVRPALIPPRSPSQSRHTRHYSFAEFPNAPGQYKLTRVMDDQAVQDDNVQQGRDVQVPLLIQEGTPMIKVSAKKKKMIVLRIDPEEGYLLWESKKSGVLALEKIKELRFGADARYYREQFQLSQEYEKRWISIIYILDGSYKTLHLVATTIETYQMWETTLQKLYAIRQELMSGVGNVEMRQEIWERRYWKGADVGGDEKLEFAEVEKMCRRLNVNFPTEYLMRRFQEADSKKQGYLDFTDFQRFVKLIKIRPEIQRLYIKLSSSRNGVFDFTTFETFMHDYQKSSLSTVELERIFKKFAVPVTEDSQTKPPASPRAYSAPTVLTTSSIKPDAQSQVPAGPPNPQSQDPDALLVLTVDGFTSFLLSPENAAFLDHHGKVYQDMTKPLSEYYISSSHNTYLVGHQLVGVSTIEGYIRALLHSCRSVELDIFDGDTEPLIYHGKTLTSRVPLRDICQAIAKYAFVASPYPIIISAEIHCSLPQQTMIAQIMRECFGEALVTEPLKGRTRTDVLPSPEELKGRVLVKAKNLLLRHDEPMQIKGVTVDAESSTSETTTSDSEVLQHEFKEIKNDLKYELQRARNAEPIRELKEEMHKARGLVHRMHAYTKPRLTSPPTSPPHSPPSHSVTLPSIEQTDSQQSAQSRPFPLPSSIEQTDSQLTIRPQALPLQPSRSSSQPSTPSRPSSSTATATNTSSSSSKPPKQKMSLALVALLVYTIGVKCRGFNKKEHYPVEHVFSLSERTANKVMKESLWDLVKHNRTHVVRIYPNGTRLNSSNFEPHKYWASGAQLVAINWQTFDMGYMLNHAMFQRNGRAGYVLKPLSLRSNNKEALERKTRHFLDVTVISAQQLPRPKALTGHELFDNSVVDPYVEVSIHIPDWAHLPFFPDTPAFYSASASSSASSSLGSPTTTAFSGSRTISYKTGVVKNNGFNPVWEEKLSIPFDCVGGMMDLVFVKFAVIDEHGTDGEPLAVYCISLGSLLEGYRHLPLHDSQLSQYLFSTLFVHIAIRNAYPEAIII